MIFYLFLRGVSSVGRAPRWHCGGQRFEPATLQYPGLPLPRRAPREEVGIFPCFSIL